MANILLGVTGSVAAIHTPILYEELRHAGHAVKIVATRAAQYFFDANRIDGLNEGRNRDAVILDEDEWPGHDHGRRYERGDLVVHIELRRWADLLLVAPLDANTLAKLAGGLCDNCLTCVWRAWEPVRPVILAPAMNTLMWQNPFTGRHLSQLAEMNAHGFRIKIVPPAVKKLACDDFGVGAMAERPEIMAAVAISLREAEVGGAGASP